jgi:hypothetical protein
MIITRLIGGLGNQMFQYAAGLALAKQHGVELTVDLGGFDQYSLRRYSLAHFALEPRPAPQDALSTAGSSSLIARLRRKLGIGYGCAYTIYRETSLRFNNEFKKLPNNTYLDGYWQCEAYFSEFTDAVRQAFAFRTPASGINAEWLAHIRGANAIAIHVRRGDYANNPKTFQVHGLCSLDYYHQAALYMEQHANEAPEFFIFSDDPDWAKENLKLDHPMHFVTHNNAETDYEDLRLMSACKHQIVANSTFSWWGAWLAKSEEQIVIAPKNWFASEQLDSCDIVPHDWIQL